jgi:mannose-1-phosphate guanylyltransferase
MKAVILAGGTGTRLWPMSHDLKPKQFHAFVGKRTMLQQTFDRLSFLKPADIFVATNAAYETLVKKQLPQLRVENLIIERAMRDTGPCICFAAHYLKTLGFQDEVMAIIYADHLIQNNTAFEKALKQTAKLVALGDRLGVVAVRAKYANPNLGYIKIGKLAETTDSGLEVYELDQFVEKPTEERAKKFLSSYKYLWNTGLYVWKVSTILKQFKKRAPKIYRAAASEKTYEQAPKISIDYALIEKMPPRMIRVVPAELEWNDIGNWAALYEELTSEEFENVSSGEHIAIDTEGSLVIGNAGKPIVTYGVKNMVIVDAPEALLIMPKEKAAGMKKIVEALKKKYDSIRSHRPSPRR